MSLTRRLTTNTVLVTAAALFATLLVVSIRSPTVPRSQFFVAGCVGFILSVVMAGVIARRTARPIVDLRNTARAIAAGDRTLRPALVEPGETGEIADALRRLVEQAERQADELNAEEALLVALTESLNEGVIAVNARQQVLRINDTARQQLRIKDSVPFSVSFLPRDRTLREALDIALAGRDAEPGEARVDGEILSVTARPLAGGGAVLALYNLTPFRRLEAVRRDFVANVSHELRTPLTIISGFVDTLRDEALPAELRREFLAMAATNVQRMQRIVDDLLDLSRIESGGWLPNPHLLDLQVIAAEVVQPLAEPARKKGVRLEIDIDVRAGKAYIDATAARQILTNLAENALRHTSSGAVQVFSERADGGVWVGVRDTGNGIASEHLGRIFERFYRADPGRARDAGGTGLGLSIVKHLTEAHGGRVRADSTVNTGTTIVAWFPDAEQNSR